MRGNTALSHIQVTIILLSLDMIVICDLMPFAQLVWLKESQRVDHKIKTKIFALLVKKEKKVKKNSHKLTSGFKFPPLRENGL